jgi:hypothetical protein
MSNEHSNAAFARSLVATLAILLTACESQDESAPATPTSAPDRPNIIFVMSDDHAYQAIGAYGSVLNETPNIDRICDQLDLLAQPGRDPDRQTQPPQWRAQ